MRRRDSHSAASDSGGLPEEHLEALLSADGLSPAERASIRAGVLRAVVHREAWRHRLFSWSLVPAAAAGLVLGVIIARTFRPSPPPRLEPDRATPTASPHGDAAPPPAIRPDRPPAPSGIDRSRIPVASAHSPRAVPAGLPLTMEGTVVGPEGRPVPDALVAGIGALRAAATGVAPTGHFLLRIGPHPVASSFVRIEPPPGSGLRPIVYRHTPGAPVQLRFEAGRTVGGRVVDAETGRAVADARVERSLFWGAQLVHCEVVKSGMAGFTLGPLPVLRDAERSHVAAAQVLQLTVQAAGYASRFRSFRSAGDLERALERPIALRPGGRISVHVSTPDGLPLPNALVRLRPAAPPHEPFAYRAPNGPRTDADGRVLFESVPAGAVRIAADHPDAQPVPEAEVGVAPRTTARVEITLTPGRRLGGRVTGPEGRPLAGAVLYALPERTRKDGDRAESALAHGPVLTDRDGRFVFRGLPPGTCELRAYHFPPLGPEAKARRLAGQRTGQLGLEIRLEPSAVDLVLSVREAGSGEPLPAATVTLLGPGGRAIRQPQRLADGRFLVKGVDPSRTALQVFAPGWLPSSLRRLRLPSGPARVEVEIRLHRPSCVSGVVVDRTGAPVAGALVSSGREEVEPIRPDGRSFHSAGFLRTAVTDADGRFTLTGLRILDASGRGFELVVLRPDREPYPVRGLTLLQGESLEGLRITLP